MPDKKPKRDSRSGRAAAAGPTPGQYPVRFGTAELLADADRPGGWLLTVDDVPQSYVRLTDPTYLDFDYVRRMGDVLDVLEPAGAPLDAVHIGGGACTLPRYLAATRPGSRQLVIEADGQLADLVREQLGLRSVPKLRVRIGDGRTELATLRDDSADLVVVDAFVRAAMPDSLATAEAAGQIRRVLRDNGVYLLNIAADPTLRAARRVLAATRGVFADVVAVADPAVLRGRRPGNLVVAAGAGLPVEALRRRAAGAAFPVRLLAGPELAAFVGAAGPITDADVPNAPNATPPDSGNRYAEGQDADVTR